MIQARRERQDKISRVMGDYLLKGYRMLGECCEECGVRPGACAGSPIEGTVLQAGAEGSVRAPSYPSLALQGVS